MSLIENSKKGATAEEEKILKGAKNKQTKSFKVSVSLNIYKAAIFAYGSKG